MIKNFLCGLTFCLALGVCTSAHADDERVAGPNGVLYRIAPTDPVPQPAATQSHTGQTVQNHDRSGIGEINVQSIASQAKHYNQPMNSSNHSSAY